MKEKQVVIITGMPRSGTSLLSSILQEAGVKIGDNLVEPSRGNEYGHFEDVDFFRFHEDLLHCLGHTVFIQNNLDLGSIPPEATEKAKRLIEQRQHHSLWGWKDPRTALFLDFWQHLIPHACYIFVYRHPLEVVLSILRRGTDPDVLTNPFAGLKSWEIYNQAILNFYTRHSDRCVLAHIRTVTADEQKFIGFIADKLRLPLRKEGTQQLFKAKALKQVQSIQEVFPLLGQVRSESVEIYDRLETQADLPQNILFEPAPSPHNLQHPISERFNNISSEEQAVDKFLLLLALLNPRALLNSRKHLDDFRIGWMTHAQNVEAHAANLEKFVIDLRDDRYTLDKYISSLEAENEDLVQRLAAVENTKIWRVAKKWYKLKSLAAGGAKTISQQLLPPRFRLWAKFQYQSAQIWRKSRYPQQFSQPHSKPKTINGLSSLIVYPEMGAPTRYRVFNQVAQMELLDLHPMPHQTDELEALDGLSQADLLYLYRVEATPLIKSLVKGAKQRRIPVIFDTDDLIWDQRIEAYCFLRDHWPDREVDDFLVSVQRHEVIMEQVDYFVTSTPFLAKMAESHFRKRAFVNKNAIDQTAQTVSQPFYQARQNRGIPHTAAMVTIVYASGWFRAHQEDFEVAVEALRQVLRDRPQVRLKIIGYLELDGLFTGYEERIEFQKFVDWKKLLEILSKIDINLAPIVTNPQRRSKSAVKFLEAALVGVPTVASNLEPYHDIDHGKTGFLAGSTAEWYDCLIQLIDSPELRYQMGQAAHEKVLACDTVQKRATQLQKTLHQIIEDYYGGS